MTRKLTTSDLIIASHNNGKVREIAELLAPYNLTITGAAELDLPEPVEDADTFEGNAALKALAAAKATGKPSLSDDSGLCVNALGGKPGIHSARYAGETKDFALAMQRIQDELDGKDDHSAYFVCVLTLAWPDGYIEHFRGEIHGHLTFPARGDKGFGYDPIFIPEGHTKTFAEIEPTEKHALSHRARAFERLVQNAF